MVFFTNLKLQENNGTRVIKWENFVFNITYSLLFGSGSGSVFGKRIRIPNTIGNLREFRLTLQQVAQPLQLAQVPTLFPWPAVQSAALTHTPSPCLSKK